MENSLRVPEHQPNRRRVRSDEHIRNSERTNTAAMGLRRAISERAPPRNAGGDTARSYDYLALLYNITDIVLVLCAGIVVGSCIATLVLCGYGYYHRDPTNHIKNYIILH